ncbi:hypothetical protein AADZ90_019140 [Aestuariibius sp. 2305UL40-4]|uniref:hypothetical protein n=1 Tax=Aestuariibius violaceus TaxID=3234132 RepID=UPI00345EC190
MGLFPKVDLKVIAWDFDGVLNRADPADSIDLDDSLLFWAEVLAQKSLRHVALADADAERATLIETHLGDWPSIEQVFASGLLGSSRPDPAFFDAVTDTLAIKPGEAMLIDASGTNVNAAAGQGWRSFRYSPLAKDALKRSLGL